MLVVAILSPKDRQLLIGWCGATDKWAVTWCWILCKQMCQNILWSKVTEVAQEQESVTIRWLVGGKTRELTEVKKPEEQMHQPVCSETKGDDATDSLRQKLASKRSQFWASMRIASKWTIQWMALNIKIKGSGFYGWIEVKWKSLSRAPLFATPWNTQSMELSRQNVWVDSLSRLQGIFPTQGFNPSLCIAGRFFSSWTTREAQEYWSG